MIKTVNTLPEEEKALLVTVGRPDKKNWPLEDKKDEFEKLVVSCGARIQNNFVCRIKEISPRTFIGKGKIEEIYEYALENGSGVVIFSEDLTPSQQKNVEEIFGIKTIDRTQLILDVFARRAQSNEGKLQVELAQLMYLLPRLSGQGIFLSRIGGGMGTRGPGEQKLEIDRRRVRSRISRIKKDLGEISVQRRTRRARRDRFSSFLVALVGYTNSGKSTLFNAITGSGVSAKDQLFSTLDATVRKMNIIPSYPVLVSDTVGFLNELPHHLIESFKATLEEVANADMLLHVLDISDNCIEQKNDAVFEILKELNVLDKPILTVLNKGDKIPDVRLRERMAARMRASAVVSAIRQEGLERLAYSIIEEMERGMVELNLVIPSNKSDIIGFLRKNKVPFSEKYTEKGIKINAKVNPGIREAVFRKLSGR